MRSVVESVRGAQKWVGNARWHYGSFYLWGDVPALMPPINHQRIVGYSDPRRNGGKGAHLTSQRENDGRKVPGMNWSRHGDPDYKPQGFNVTAAQRYREEFKVTEDGVKGFTPNGQPLGKNTLGRRFGSKSDSRKAASAMIAKIPFPLSSHIARCFKPQGTDVQR